MYERAFQIGVIILLLTLVLIALLSKSNVLLANRSDVPVCVANNTVAFTFWEVFWGIDFGVGRGSGLSLEEYMKMRT